MQGAGYYMQSEHTLRVSGEMCALQTGCSSKIASASDEHLRVTVCIRLQLGMEHAGLGLETMIATVMHDQCGHA